MVITFASDRAREFLLKNGCVYTFRLARRSGLGKDWMREKRSGRKMADVYIEEIGEFSPYKLEPYVKESGFTSLSEWITEIKKLNIILPSKGFLYKVSILKKIKYSPVDLRG